MRRMPGLCWGRGSNFPANDTKTVRDEVNFTTACLSMSDLQHTFCFHVRDSRSATVYYATLSWPRLPNNSQRTRQHHEYRPTPRLPHPSLLGRLPKHVAALDPTSCSGYRRPPPPKLLLPSSSSNPYPRPRDGYTDDIFRSAGQFRAHLWPQQSGHRDGLAVCRRGWGGACFLDYKGNGLG